MYGRFVRIAATPTVAVYVRFGPQAEIALTTFDVCYSPECGRQLIASTYSAPLPLELFTFLTQLLWTRHIATTNHPARKQVGLYRRLNEAAWE